jgi:hypothetical protein
MSLLFLYNFCLDFGSALQVKANASLESLQRKTPQLALKQYIQKTRKENEEAETDKAPVDDEESKEISEVTHMSDEANCQDCAGQVDSSLISHPKGSSELAEEQRQDIQEPLELVSKEVVKQTKLIKRSNKDYISKTDPDSKIARKPGKPTNLYYSTHYSVDRKGRIITDVYTSTADKNDSDILLGVVNRVEKRLKELGLELKSVGADKNYCSGKNLRELEKSGKIPYIPTRKYSNKTGGLSKEDFKYDENGNKYICPMGKELKYHQLREGYAKIYFASKQDCSKCQIKDKCIPKGKKRKIQHTIYNEEYKRLAERSKTWSWKQMLIIRKINTEPLFAEAKANHGLSKFMTRGRDKAQKNSLMIAVVQNLKRIMKVNGKNKKVSIQCGKILESGVYLQEKIICGIKFIIQKINFLPNLQSSYCL